MFAIPLLLLPHYLPKIIRVCSSVIFTLSLFNWSCEGAQVVPATANATPANLTTLKLVQIISRHGDRAPILPFPTDPYKNASVYSINGWGELSELGAKQVFALGSYIRQRYDGFLAKKYRKRDFLMQSSDLDRAIMSAESYLAGLYELGPVPRSKDIFREWQPVPIHTIPKEEDNFIEAKASCPRHLALFKEYMSSAEHTSFVEENKEFIDFIADMSGLDEIRQDFEFIFRVQDALQCQVSHNLTLPSWANITVLEKLRHFKALSFQWPLSSFEMQRLRVGPLLQKLVDRMRAKVETLEKIRLNSNSSTASTADDLEDHEIPPYEDPIGYRKLYAFSGHDSTISGLLSVISPQILPIIPKYASALIVELHRTQDQQYFVELLFKNETSENKVHRLDLSPFCELEPGSTCSFSQFSSSAAKYIPLDWRAECQLQASKNLLMMSSSSGSPSGGSWDMGPGHPLGLAAPGLAGFVLSVIAVSSLLASAILLLSLLLRNNNVITRGFSSRRPESTYHHFT